MNWSPVLLGGFAQDTLYGLMKIVPDGTDNNESAVLEGTDDDESVVFGCPKQPICPKRLNPRIMAKETIVNPF
jgi:hypothetical protein